MTGFSARAPRTRTSDQREYETFDRQGFKAHANNALLWLRVSAVSCESYSTAEWMHVGLYSIYDGVPELQQI